MTGTIEHDTIVLERDYDAAPERVFAAWADPAARMRWCPPSPQVTFWIEGDDFRAGGDEVAYCGPREAPEFRIEVRYHDIVPGQRIVYSEAVVTNDERLLAVSLISVLLEPAGSGTRLVLTDQITALDGSDMIAGSRGGYGASLDNLARELAGELLSH